MEDAAVYTREDVAQVIAAMPDGPDKDAAALAALDLFGPAPPPPESEKFAPYQYFPEKYIAEKLGWTPWKGINETRYPGQVEILQACARAVRAQVEKRAFDKGELNLDELTCWKPGDVIQNWIRVKSGNGIGKTKTLSGVVQWYFDCFESVVYTYSTTATNDEITTWAEIGQDRAGKGLPGTLLKTKIYLSANRFAMSRSPSDSGGTGEERAKGKHKEFLLFVIDEADGAQEFIFKAIETMASGGVSLVLMMANPRSRASKFHRIGGYSYVDTLTVSTLYHPNVVQNKEIIPGAVMRDFVEKEIEKGCEIVHNHSDETCACRVNCLCNEPVTGVPCEGAHKNKLHDIETFTFELPYSVQVGRFHYAACTIFRPSADFMTRILGIAPPQSLDKTVISAAVYENSKKREPTGGDKTFARVGVDGARRGIDKGSIYIRWQDAAWCAAELAKAETADYIDVIKTNCLKLKEKGVTSLHVRVDTAYGTGVIDGLRIDADMIEAFPDYEVFEVHFGGSAYNKKDYDNVVTEMYYEAAESLKEISLLEPFEELEGDLCEREYKFINRGGKTRKILEEKDKFRDRIGRSPDHGDGLVMAIAPDYCFNKMTVSVGSVSLAKNKPQNTKSSMENLLAILNKNKN